MTTTNVDGQRNRLVLEVAQHLGENRRPHHRHGHHRRPDRGTKVTDTGAPIVVPVGPGRSAASSTSSASRSTSAAPSAATEHRRSIARPEFVDQSTEARSWSPASRSSTCWRPYAKGGKIGLFGGAGVGKTVTIMN